MGTYKQSRLAHKKLRSTHFLEKRMLLAFFCVAGVIFFVEHFTAIFSYVNPVKTEKVLALDKLKTPKSLFSPTPTPVKQPLFSVSALATPTASPTPTKAPLVAVQAKNDYCLYVPMLLYHHVQPLDQAKAEGHAQLAIDSTIFDSQMAYLASQGYHTITSSDVVFALRNHTTLPPKSIVVTVDDGYDDAYNYAFQSAKKYNLKMDFMVPSGLIQNPGYMTWDQLKEMSNNSLITIYNHTWSHAALGNASEATIDHEVTTANTQLEQNLGKKINIFVYPYGSFGPTVINFLETHGFIGALSTLPGKTQCESFIMTLHRDRIGNAPLSSYGF